MPELAIDPLTLTLHLAMALSLAACAGMRAFLPLFGLGLVGRLDLVPLAESFDFLSSTPALVAFGGASILEALGDKVVVVDHALDAVSTFIRPVAGTLLAAASMSELDPVTATAAGIVLGGGAATTVHIGKAAVRAKSTATAPLHGGLGNAALSVGEDIATFFGVLLSLFMPIIALLFALVALVLSVMLIRTALRAGQKLAELIKGDGAPPIEPPA